MRFDNIVWFIVFHYISSLQGLKVTKHISCPKSIWDQSNKSLNWFPAVAFTQLLSKNSYILFQPYQYSIKATTTQYSFKVKVGRETNNEKFILLLELSYLKMYTLLLKSIL